MRKMRRRMAAAVLAVVMMLSMGGGTTTWASPNEGYESMMFDAGDPDDAIREAEEGREEKTAEPEGTVETTAEPEKDTDSDRNASYSEADSRFEIETESEMNPDSASEAQLESEINSEADPDSEFEVGSESEFETESESESVSGSESESESESEEPLPVIPVDELTDERILDYIDRCLDEEAILEAAAVSEQMLDGETADEAERIPTEASSRVQVTPVNHTISIQYTIVDREELGGASTITDMWENHWEAYLATYDIFAQMYEVDDNEDCFVAFINANLMNGQGAAVAMDLTDGDGVHPVSYDSKITYDRETGLIYMPRSLFYDSEGRELPAGTEELQLQLMIAVDLGELENGIRVTTENYRDDVEAVAEHQTVDGRSLNIETTIPLVTSETARYVDLSKVYLYLNDSVSYQIFEEGKYYFDRSTGELTIPVSPITLYSVRVVIDDDTWLEKLSQAFTTTVYAATETVVSASSMQTVPGITLALTGGAKVGEYVDLTTTQKYAAENGGTYYSNYSSSQKECLLDSALYLYYPIDDTLNASYINLVDRNQGQLSSLLGSKAIGRYTTESYRWLYENQFYFISSTPTGELKTSGGAVLDVTELHSQLPWIALHCTHQSSSLGTHANTNGEYTDTCRYRILDVDTAHRTIVIGMLVPKQQTQSGAGIFKFTYKTKTGNLRAAKKGSATNQILAGAEYRVYKDKECKTLLKDVNGSYTLKTLAESPYSNTLTYPVGTVVYVKEIKAPVGTTLDPTVYKSTIESGVTNWANGAKNSGGFFVDTEYGHVCLLKVDEDTGEVLEGASYGAYKEFECTTALTDVKNQILQWTNVPSGGETVDCALKLRLWLREENAPEGYEISTDRYCVDLAANTYRIRRYDETHRRLSDTGELPYEKDEKGIPLVKLTVSDRIESEETIPFSMQVVKKSLEEAGTDDSMEGAIFVLEYWSVEQREKYGLTAEEICNADSTVTLGDPEAVWYYRTNEEGRVQITDSECLLAEYTFEDNTTVHSGTLPTDEEGKVFFPIGSYRIREISPPSLYGLDGMMYPAEDVIAASGLLLTGGGSVESTEIGRTALPTEGLRFDMIMTSSSAIEADSEAAVQQIWCRGSRIREELLVVEVRDNICRNSVTVIKSGSDRKPLAGVVFHLEKTDGSEQKEMTTGEDGHVLWEDLLPGDYILTEVKTVDGYELLAESVPLTLPLQMTKEEVQEQKADTTDAYYDEVSGTYCFAHLTYEIADSVSLDLPVTGGTDSGLLWTALFGILLLAGGILLEWYHHRTGSRSNAV